MSDVKRYIERLIRPEIRALTSYHVPDATGLVKLDAMENPYRWPPALTGAWLETLRGVELNRYPDPHARALTAQLASAMHVPSGLSVLLGNGSDELIQMLALAVTGGGVLAPEPGFVMYRMIATVCGLPYTGVPLRADFSLDTQAMLAAIARDKPALIFLAVPNNPTGNVFDRAAITAILRATDALVVIDEAYAPFTTADHLDLPGQYPHLLVMRTVSKLGLAGLRLGWLAGAPEWIAELDKIRLPYNINALTQASATFALEHRAVLDEQAARIRAERARLHAALAALPGITVWPSEANFLLFRVHDAPRIHAQLRDVARVLVKNLHGTHPALENCLRVTVGTPEENDRFIAGLDAACSGRVTPGNG